MSSTPDTSSTTATTPTTGGMNAKERRAARRKAEQQSRGGGTGGSSINKSNVEATGGDPTSVATSPPQPPTAAEAVGTTAKERRAAKRAAQRATAVATGGTGGDNVNDGSSAATSALAAASIFASVAGASQATTAKERRAAKRAATRDAAAAGSSSNNNNSAALSNASSEPAAPSFDSVAPTAATATTAKERRLLRREEERRKREREGDGGTGGTSTTPPAKRTKGAAARGGRVSGGGRGDGRANPHIVFVGQLAFSTTAEGLEEHFRTRGGVTGKMSVRLLTRKGTDPPRSKGMAFVEVEDAETAYQCRSLHHSRLDGRLLNVERTSGGGKGKKGERIQEKRVEQKQFMKSVVQRVLGEFIDAGRLGKTELDDAAKEVLEKMEAKVMERAVKDYCDKPDRLELHNPSAWFTHHAHELAFRADPENLDAGARDWLNDERIKAGGRSRDKDRAAKKGRGERGSGGRGHGGGGREKRGRGMGGRGPGAEGGRGRGGDGGRAGHEGAGIENSSATEAKNTSHAAKGGTRDQQRDGSGGVRGLGREPAKVAPPVDQAKGQYPRRDQRDTSDLMSIFPSLRGRGNGREGSMAGRGGGGRGFRQGGIHA